MRRARFDSRVLLLLVFLVLYLPFAVRSGYRLTQAHHSDFPTFYFAARAALKVNTSPYQQLFARGFSPTGDVQHYVFPYLYPPPSLVLFYPYTWFGYETAKRIHLGLSHLGLLVVLYLVAIKLLNLNPRRAPDAARLALIGCVTFLFSPLVVTLRAGQTNVLGVLAIVVAWYGLSRQRHLLAGVGIALAGLLKTYPMLLAVAFVFLRRWRSAAWAAACVAAFAAAALWAVPYVAWSDWWTKVLPNARYGSTPEGLGSVVGPWNQGVAGFSARLFVPNEFCEALLPSAFLAHSLPYVLAFLLTAVTLSAAFRAFSATRSHPVLAPADHAPAAVRATGQNGGFEEVLALHVATLLLLVFMIAPISWEHHLVFVLPSLYVALASIGSHGRHPASAAGILVAAALLAAPFPVQYGSLPGIAPWLQSGIPTLLISSKLYCVAFVWGLLVHDLWKAGGRVQATRSTPAAGVKA